MRALEARLPASTSCAGQNLRYPRSMVITNRRESSLHANQCAFVPCWCEDDNVIPRLWTGVDEEAVLLDFVKRGSDPVAATREGGNRQLPFEVTHTHQFAETRPAEARARSRLRAASRQRC